MADSRLPALTEISAPDLLDELYMVDVSDSTDHASGTSRKITGGRLGGLLAHGFCGGRLTTESGVSVSPSDRTAQGTLYFTPHEHNLVGLYDGTRWKLHAFTERSLSLSLTAANNYDVWLYDNSGTLTLETLVWTNATTRATALAMQDGVLVKNGDATRRYLGTIRASGANVVEDSLVKRFVWNNYNRVPRAIKKSESSSHTYNGGYRQWRSQAANQVEFVLGIGASVTCAVFGEQVVPASAGVYAIVAQNIDTTSSFDSYAYLVAPPTSPQAYGLGAGATSQYQVGIGYHYIAGLQSTASVGTSTFLGFGLAGTILG